jgi:hypothetical protein
MSSVNFYPRRQGPHLDTAGAIRHPTPTRVGVTTMLQEEGPIENLDVRESSSASLPKLADLARQAYGQKRAKDCLDLTRAILLIDPENVEAQLMRSAIRAEIHQSLEDSQALLRSAQLKQNPEAPQSSVDIAQESPDSDQEADEHQALRPESNAVSADGDETPPTFEESLMMVVSNTTPDVPLRNHKRIWLRRAGIVAVLGLIAAGLPSLRSKSNPVQVPHIQATDGSTQSPADVNKAAPVVPLVSVAPAEGRSVSVDPASPPSVSPAPSPVPTKPRDNPTVLAASGTLAISSATTVDIYMNDLYVGSAPVSLDISPGIHTLEYRHGNLRKRVTHVINSAETTKAMITFDVALQINAKPWAEVFLDGTARKPLGQTPLSGVQVPIGAVLVFENPEFQAKRYRVTGNETGIQIVFP